MERITRSILQSRSDGKLEDVSSESFVGVDATTITLIELSNANSLGIGVRCKERSLAYNPLSRVIRRT